MRSFTRTALTWLAGAAVITTPLGAQDSRANLLVTPQWLSQHLRDQNLVLLHVGEKADYDKAHIPGARFVDYHDVAPMDDAEPKLTMQMPPDDTLRARLARLGVSDDSRVIIYFANEYVSPSTRVVLTLDYAGFGAATSMLDGGIGAWTRAGNATTTEVPPARAGKLSPLKTRPVIVSAEFVRDNIGKPGVAVVDGRGAVFYDGVSDGGPRDARKKGHIKGALSIPFTEVTAENLEFKSAGELAALFTKAGVKPGDTVIGYCHIGQQATAMLFAARTLGFNVRLFDGSFEQWARLGWPVEVPPGK